MPDAPDPQPLLPGLPRFQQVREYILNLLAKTEPEGQRRPLCTEQELAERFGLSRMTVRRALDKLAAEGLLVRLRGKGTFAPLPHLRAPLQQIERVFADWQVEGRQVQGEALACRQEPCPPEWAAALALPPGAPVVYVCRRRFAELVPMALDFRYLPLDVGQVLSPREVAEESLVQLLTRKLHLRISAARAELGAAAADPRTARLLLTRTGAPLLRRQVVIHADARPVIAGYSLFRSDVFRYTLTYP